MSVWLADLMPDDNGATPVPASSPAEISAAEKELGAGPVAWAIQTAAGAAAKIARQVPDVTAGSAGLGTSRRSSEACLLAILRGLRHDTPAEGLQAPAAAIEGNRELVHRGCERPVGHADR